MENWHANIASFCRVSPIQKCLTQASTLSKGMSVPASIPHSPPTAFNPFYVRWSNAPLPGESEEQVTVRVKSWQEAVKRSKEIDESLLETRIVLERRKKAVKILLLGARLAAYVKINQTELSVQANQKAARYVSQSVERDPCQFKRLLWLEFRSQEYVVHIMIPKPRWKINSDFQLAFAPRQFESNRLTWKLIVQLNLIKYALQSQQHQKLKNCYRVVTSGPSLRPFLLNMTFRRRQLRQAW